MNRFVNGLGWRLDGAFRFVAGYLAAGFLAGVVSWAAFRWLPRAILIPIERVLLAAWGDDAFDAQHYLATNHDVAEANVDPLAHYLRSGWREGRTPNPHFDDGHYRALAVLSVDVPVSPLAHYVALGRRNGFAPTAAADPEALGRAAPALEIARMDAYRGLVGGAVSPPDEGRPQLARVQKQLAELHAADPASAEVDVLMPVFRGRAETLNAILHVLTAENRTELELVVIDDATPDGDLADDLRDLRDKGLITLVRNRSNLGFPGAINRGAELHKDRDVIWLNADTEVYDFWADRLRDAAYSQPQVATVTPLTNSGTICSYPCVDKDNFGELEIPWADVDRLAANVNAGVTVESPTAVGFVTYVRRSALDEIGGLDCENFGRGYGEENDFCQRAIGAGWRNLLAANVVVRHFGATSFRGERARRVASAMKKMDRLHPSYHRDVQKFITDDPLAAARRRLDLQRLVHGRTDRTALLVTHSRGGGTAQHVHEETARLIERGWTVYVLTGGKSGQGTAKLSRVGVGPLPSLEALDLEGPDLWGMIGSLRLSKVDLHHMIDFPNTAPDLFRERLKDLDLAYEVMVHDYFAICPRINLIDQGGRYCGEPDIQGCARCLLRRGSVVGRPDIHEWRRRHGALLRGAERVRVPDDDVAERLKRYLPDLAIDVVPHDNVVDAPTIKPQGGVLKIAILGAIGPIKGFDAVLGLARHIIAHKLPIRITVIGYTHNDVAARAAGINVTGAYTNDRAQELIARTDPHLIWVPSLWPETYCYTLSIALASGRPVAAFDIGAQAARLRRLQTGTLIPLSDAFRPKVLLPHLQKAAGFGESDDAKAA